MRREWLVIGVLAVAGCVSYSEIKDRPPLFTAHSSKAPQGYVECVLPKWIDTNAAAHIVSEGDDRVVVVPLPSSGDKQVLMTMTASPKGAGSDVSMRLMPSLASYQKQQDEARSCL